MRLKRIGHAAAQDHYADSDEYSSRSAYRGGEDGGQRVYNHFLRFGGGSENFNDFRVSLEWSDVEAIIQIFSASGHAEAMRLERARKLGAAVEELVKISN
jgi:hypothetical protein